MKRRQNQIMLACLLAFGVAVGCSGSAVAGSAVSQNWELAYANDADGFETPECQQNPECGIDILRTAIERGAQVRVGVYFSSITTAYYHDISTVVLPDNPGEPIAGTRFTFNYQAIWVYNSFKTNGDLVTRDSAGGDSTGKAAFEWYVNK